MTDGIKQTELLAELHADPGAEIRRLLDEAVEHDTAARAKRREAGRLLEHLRAEHPQRWQRMAGINPNTAELLIQMSRGRE